MGTLPCPTLPWPQPLTRVLHACAELSQSTGSFAKSAAMLGNCEEHTGLSRALSKLAEVCERVEQVQGRQAKQDFYCLAELVKDYVSLVGAIKEALHQRVKVYGTWQHAQQTLARKREAKAKLELAQKADRLPQARQEVLDWEAKVDRAQEEFDSVSRVIRAELDRFELDRIADFRASVVRYLEFLLDTQQQVRHAPTPRYGRAARGSLTNHCFLVCRRAVFGVRHAVS